MGDTPSKAKWHQIDAVTAKTLSNHSSTPGVVYPVGSSGIPQQLQGIPGAVSFFVSSYGAPIPITPGITAGGELAVVRHDANTAKAYNYIFATSSNGLVYFSGPHKDFPSHHFPASSSVPIESLFGHPFTKGKM